MLKTWMSCVVLLVLAGCPDGGNGPGSKPSPEQIACEAGLSWDDDGDSSTACAPVSEPCAAGFEQVQPPTVTSDRACSACNPGEFCEGAEATADPCLAGVTWDDDADPSTRCVPTTPLCTAGFVETQAPDETTDRVCQACAPGEYCAGDTVAPVSCVAGTSWDHDASPATDCVAVTPICAVGTSQTTAPTVTVDRACTSCTPGSYCAGDTAAPVSCAVGTSWDHDASAATDCVAVTSVCVAGTSETTAPSTTVDRACTSCTPGSYCAGDTNAPASCVVGTTWDDDQSAATDCVAVTPACAAGTWESTSPTPTTDRACTACSPGQYCAGGTTSPESCDPGTTWDDDGSPATACVAPSDCGLEQVTVDAPTATADRTCGECGRNWVPSQLNVLECDSWADPVFDHVGAGLTYTCGVRADDGSVLCWGQEGFGDFSEVPTGPHTEVHGGSRHLCAVREDDQTLDCWGSGGVEVTDAPTDPVSQVSIDLVTSCAIDAATDFAQCWGPDTYGVVSDVPGGVAYDKIVAASGNVCAIRMGSGLLDCWGSNPSGQLNQFPLADAYVDVAGTGYMICAIRADDGTLDCFGSFSNRPAAGVAYDELAAGQGYMCGIRTDNREVDCWAGPSTAPALTEVPAGVTFDGLYPGAEHICGFRSDDGSLMCWGKSWYGTLGLPTDQAYDAVAIGFGDDISACGQLPDGTLDCWGSPDSIWTDAPTVAVDAFDVGMTHGCAVRQDNLQLTCWGQDTSGSVSAQPVGVQVQGVSLGQDFGCTLRESDGELLCWGADGSRQVSDAPAGAHDQVSVGANFGCAIRSSDGTLACWGDDTYSQVTDAPVDAMTSVHAGRTHVCAIQTANGELACWGQDVNGSVSDAPAVPVQAADLGAYAGCAVPTPSRVPTCWGGAWREPVPENVPVSQLSVGGRSTACAIHAVTKQQFCWGEKRTNP